MHDVALGVVAKEGDDMGRPSGSAALVLVDATTPLRVEPALFAAMLEGWRRQHVARRLSPSLISDRERLVRRFREFLRDLALGVADRTARRLDCPGALGPLDDQVLRGVAVVVHGVLV